MSDDEFTIYCGNLGENVSEEILYELFLQAGPVEDVRIPTKDGRNQNYGFVTYKHKSSVNYAISIFKHVTLFDKPLMLQKRSNKNNNRHRANKSNGENFRGGYPSELIREDLRSSLGGGRKHSRMYEDDMTASLRGSSSRYADPSLAPLPRSIKRPDDIPSLYYQSHPNMYSSRSAMSYPASWDPYEVFPSSSMINPHVDPRSSRNAYPSQYGGSYRSSREERSNSSALLSEGCRIVTTRNHSHRHKQHDHHSRSSHHKSHKSHRRQRN